MKGDLETMGAGIADDAIWHVPGKHRFAGEFSGKTTILGRFQEMAQAGVRITLDEIHDVLGNDEHVVALMRTSVDGPNGSSSQSSVWVMHVSDGKATEFWVRNENQDEIDRVIG